MKHIKVMGRPITWSPHNFIFTTQRLEVCVVRSAGEGDDVADVGHTGHEEQQTLEAEAEA